MTKKSTVIYLKDTGHVLAAYDRRSGAPLPNPLSSTGQVLRKDLRVRLLEPFGAFAVKSKEDTDKTTTSMKIVNAEAFFTIPSGQFEIGDAIGKINRATIANSNPKEAEIEFSWEKEPSTTIVKETLVRLPRTPRSRRDLSYQFPPRVLAVSEVDDDGRTLLSRPTSFVFNDGKASEQTANNAPTGITKISLTARNTRIELKLTLDEKNPIKKDIPVVCVMKTENGENVISEAKVLAPQGQGLAEANAEIQFGGITSGKHSFLFMLKGFHPLWCDLSVGDTVSWPTST